MNTPTTDKLLSATTSRELEIELLRRAIERQEQKIKTTETTLNQMYRRHHKQRLELQRQIQLSHKT
jgi:hypothetical protein